MIANKTKRRLPRPGYIIESTLTYIILIAVCFIFFFPCLWLILASFSKTGALYDFAGFFPPAYSLDTFAKLFTDTALYDYPKWLLNTLIVSVLSCVFGTILVILTAYVMSRFRFKLRKSLMKLSLVLGMFPSFMGMTAVFLLMAKFNLINNLFALVLIYSAGAPMGYLVQKGYFDTINATIYDAARIDGASNAAVFFRIALPLSAPIIVYTALTSFSWPWSDFILPKMLLTTSDIYTVAVGLQSLPIREFSRFAAGSVFISVPIVVLYFFLVRFLVSGLSAGAVKE